MINIAVIGFGTIGSGVVRIIDENAEMIRKRIGDDLNVKYIVDIKDYTGHPLASKIVADFSRVLEDPEISIVAEMIGGLHPAYDYSIAALRAGKSVVTSNKQVVATVGDELLRTAAEHGVRYLYEASVGGGIPIIRSLTDSLAGNEICEINAILNGTTNYILTRMAKDGCDMATALAEAQQKGYAEARPQADIEGIDACRKIAILGAIIFGTLIPSEMIEVEGISNVTADDIKRAEKSGGAVKLVGRAVKLDGDKFHLSVAPYIVRADNPLAAVSDVFNGILVRGNALGDVMFYGQGAGSMPTASAVLTDILDIVSRMPKQPAQQVWSRDESRFVRTLGVDEISRCEAQLGFRL
ncbi:MAG: homoserine dehydrogenase [Eubacteriales bacterium]